jgi:ATP-dependent Clp protease ATP-binding subunit ClpC
VFDRFSDDAAAAVEQAREEAASLGHPHVGTEHLLLGLLAVDDSPAAEALRIGGATLASARHKVTEAVGMTRSQRGGELAFTARANRALERASRFSFQRHATHVDTEHVLLGVLDVEGTACQVLRGLGVDVATLRTNVGPSPVAAAPPVDMAPDAATPQCPTCGKGIADVLAHRVMTALDDAGAPRDFVVVFCSSCGSTLGVAPAAPSGHQGP